MPTKRNETYDPLFNVLRGILLSVFIHSPPFCISGSVFRRNEECRKLRERFYGSFKRIEGKSAATGIGFYKTVFFAKYSISGKKRGAVLTVCAYIVSIIIIISHNYSENLKCAYYYIIFFVFLQVLFCILFRIIRIKR